MLEIVGPHMVASCYPKGCEVSGPERKVRCSDMAIVSESGRIVLPKLPAAPTFSLLSDPNTIKARYISTHHKPSVDGSSARQIRLSLIDQSHYMAAPKTDPSLPIVWRETADPEVYEAARVGRVFNQRRPKRYPIAVVLAEKDDHVLQAVKLANQLNCRVSVRSGGHSWAAWSVRDNAVLIELGKLKHISIDEEAMIATVSPSTTGQMLNEALSAKGLMFCGGHCPDVGLGGFLLQGGMGWNCRVSAAQSNELKRRTNRQSRTGDGHVKTLWLWMWLQPKAKLFTWIPKRIQTYCGQQKVQGLASQLSSLAFISKFGSRFQQCSPLHSSTPSPSIPKL